MRKLLVIIALASMLPVAGIRLRSEDGAGAGEVSLDSRVRKFLDDTRGTWRDMNVPEVDGQALYDIILEHKCKDALEIGTSTGYSGIWIAWALSKTGGKLVTVEIDPRRRDEAVANFRRAGLDKFVDARLGDAHTIVPALEGPWDFVFCDADKEWYTQYLKATVDKIRPGGCFVAHNVFEGSAWGFGGRAMGRGGMTGDYLEFARSLPELETKVLDLRGSGGLAVSIKKAAP